MKKLLLLISVCTLFIIIYSSNASAANNSYPNEGTNGITGFAGQAKNEKGISKTSTTGGTGGQVVYINNLKELQDNLYGNKKNTRNQ